MRLALLSPLMIERLHAEQPELRSALPILLQSGLKLSKAQSLTRSRYLSVPMKMSPSPTARQAENSVLDRVAINSSGARRDTSLIFIIITSS
jgi:hypothetical protein